MPYNKDNDWDDELKKSMEGITEDNAPIILDIDGKISLDLPDDEKIPPSGIVLNKEELEARNRILPHSIPDKRFPDITHFQCINDDESYPNKELDDLLNWMDGFDLLPEDMEVYDEIITDQDTALVLHIRVEYGEVTECYLTIESDKALEKDNDVDADESPSKKNDKNQASKGKKINKEKSVADEDWGDLDDMLPDADDYLRMMSDESMNIRNRLKDVSDKERELYRNYKDTQNPYNCSMIPASLLRAYLNEYSFSDWKETILDSVEDGFEDFLMPIHVNHGDKK